MSTWLGFAVAAAALAVAGGFGVWWRRRLGRPQPVAADQRASADPGHADLLASLGVRADTPVTLLQFSSAFCAPCRATRVVCQRLAGQRPEVGHVEVDAESQLAAVRALGIWRTPTVLVIDHAGRVVTRITGAPTSTQLREAVTPLLPQPART